MSSPPPSKIARIAKTTELADLNDDCLISVFRHLPLRDLNLAGLVCHRFHDIVVNGTYRYQTQLTNINIIRMVQRLSNEDSLSHRKKCLKLYLKRFGHLIEHIDFDNNITLPFEHAKRILSMIIRFCSGTFKSLKLWDVKLDDEIIANMHDTFRRLTKLEINDNLTEILPLCPNLNTLLVEYNWSQPPLDLNYTLPKLKTFHFKCDQRSSFWNNPEEQLLLTTMLTTFFERNTNLVKLSVDSDRNGELCLDGIDHLQDLEELYMNRYVRISARSNEILNNLSKLRKVQIMNIDAEMYPGVLSRLAAIGTIEHLAIDGCRIDESSIKSLSSFTHLRYLALSIYYLQAYVELPDETWHQLRKLNGITELRIDFRLRYGYVSKFMDNLVYNNVNIKHLSMILGLLTPEWFANLSKFQNLESLKLDLYFSSDGVTRAENEAIFEQIDWQSLGRLTKIKQLTLRADISSERYLSRFLDEFGSHTTLKQLMLSSFNGNDELFQSIKTFVNLQQIEFDLINRLNSSHLKMLESLNCMKIFTVSFQLSLRSNNKFINQNIIDLVRAWPNLESLTWIPFAVRPNASLNEEIKFNSDLYKELVDVVRNRSDNRTLEAFIYPATITAAPQYCQKFVQVSVKLKFTVLHEPNNEE